MNRRRSTARMTQSIEARIKQLQEKPLDPFIPEDRIDWVPSAQSASVAVFRRIEAIALQGSASQSELDLLERLNDSMQIFAEVLVSLEALESPE